jgi:succinate dehydrogenase / fumarate reductase iron-sulfur subunit
MLINGTEKLACKTLIKDVAAQEGDVVTLEPLKSMPVQRDLMVDQSRFFENYRSVKPYLISDKTVEHGEFRQSEEERGKFEDATNCILCASCYSACPVVEEKNPDFVGPAAVVQGARFAFDNRDTGLAERLEVLDGPNGAPACENHFNCTKVCPRQIKVTKNINLLKREIKRRKEKTD